MVPSEGTVYAQVVSSKMLQRWNRVQPVTRNIPGSSQSEVSSCSVFLISEVLEIIIVMSVFSMCCWWGEKKRLHLVFIYLFSLGDQFTFQKLGFKK